MKKVADASGSKYSAGAAAEIAHEAAPAVASKPAFNPTRSGAGSSFNPLASDGSRQVNRDENVDEDGWGADAPQVSRSTVEKVQSAYQPTKVNMAELTKKREPSRYEVPSRPDTNPDVVRGGYQPIGKVDIAAIRAQAKKSEDDRPTIVKGAYEPVGKVDIAAIRAKAQKPADAPTPRPAASKNDEEEQAPKSLAERSAAFSQSERLTLPKPKVAHKFAGASNFTGTKPLTPGTFGLHQPGPQVAKSAPIGTASKTFADEGGKTPAQIWAEKKARERDETPGAAPSGPSPAATPIPSQTSGNGGWKSGYAGKSWAPVPTHATGTSAVSVQRTGEREPSPEREEAPASPAGGIAALKNKFAGAAPMGAPVMPSRTGGSDAAPPPPPMASRPKSPEPRQEEDEDRGRPNIPSPPRIQRSPSPPSREQSPVRIAMPVSRSKEPEPLSPMEEQPAPVMPVRSLEKQISRESEQDDEPVRGSDPARAAAAAVAAGAFGGAGVGAAMAHQQQEDEAPQQAAGSEGHGGKRALVQYDYEKSEDNEIELVEGDHVTNIEMVDDDWWMGTNSKGESGLFPSNYVELVEDDAAAAPAPAAPARQPSPEPAPVAAHVPPPATAAAASKGGPTATALYDYEAAEDNELSFDENDKITDLVSSILSASPQPSRGIG